MNLVKISESVVINLDQIQTVHRQTLENESTQLDIWFVNTDPETVYVVQDLPAQVLWSYLNEILDGDCTKEEGA